MHHPDTRMEILTHITSDVESLKNTCAVDKMSRALCSSKAYWVRIFREYNLVLPSIAYTTPNGWIMAFETERKIKLYVDILMNVLKAPVLEDFYGHNYPDYLGPLYISGEHFSFNQLYDIENIDAEKLSFLWHKYVITDDDTPQMVINYIDDDTYEIDFQFYDDITMHNYIYIATKNTMKDIFRRALYAKAKIYNAGSNNVKFI